MTLVDTSTAAPAFWVVNDTTVTLPLFHLMTADPAAVPSAQLALPAPVADTEPFVSVASVDLQSARLPAKENFPFAAVVFNPGVNLAEPVRPQVTPRGPAA